MFTNLAYIHFVQNKERGQMSEVQVRLLNYILVSNLTVNLQEDKQRSEVNQTG